MVGEFMRALDMDNNKNVELVGAFIVFVVTFPTHVSVFIWNGTYNFFNVPVSIEQDGKQVLVDNTAVEETSQVGFKQDNVNGIPLNDTEVENAITDNVDTPEHIDCASSEMNWTKHFFTIHPAYITEYIMRKPRFSKTTNA